MFRERPPLLSPRVEREVPVPAGYMRLWNHETDRARSPGLFSSLVFPVPTWRKDLPCLVNGSLGRGARNSTAEMRRPRPVHSSHRGVARRLAPGVLRHHCAAGPPALPHDR